MKYLLLAFTAVFVSCGSDNGVANHIDVCATNPIQGCGQTCTIDADCATGLFCGTGQTCLSECVYGGDGCAANQYCGPNGRCAPSPGGGDGGIPGGCAGLQCQQVACAGGGTTTLTGKVYTPAGDLPLYNAIVYVPNAPLPPFTPGVSCDACGAHLGLADRVGDHRPRRHVHLDNVPVGRQHPAGHPGRQWRRQVTIPKVAPCVDNPITDVNLLRLPQNKTEGDIPLMAIATGNADPFECLLRKIGIADAEIHAADGHRPRALLSRERQEHDAGGARGARRCGATLDTLKTYDVVMLPCEGG